MTILNWVDTLGMKIDIGHAYTAKIIKENGRVFHRQMYQALTQEERNGKNSKPNIVCSWSLFTRGLVLVLW